MLTVLTVMPRVPFTNVYASDILKIYKDLALTLILLDGFLNLISSCADHSISVLQTFKHSVAFFRHLLLAMFLFYFSEELASFQNFWAETRHVMSSQAKSLIGSHASILSTNITAKECAEIFRATSCTDRINVHLRGIRLWWACQGGTGWFRGGAYCFENVPRKDEHIRCVG